MGPGRLRVSGTVQRRGGNNVGGATSTIIGRRRGTRGDKNGRGGIRHVVDLITNLNEMVKGLSEAVGMMKAEEVLLEAFIKVVMDGVWGSQFESR